MFSTTGEHKEGDDDEDKEQDRLAKRFAKRARMNRILEAYEGDSQFSRSRLIDEDESTQNDLKAIKVRKQFPYNASCDIVLRLTRIVLLCRRLCPENEEVRQ